MKSISANVERVFHISIAITVSAASLVLGNAEVTWLPCAMTPAVALFSYFLVDRRSRVRLPVSVANVLGAIAFMAMAWEFSGNTLLGKLLSGAHLLVYITWVVLLLRKGIRQYWWLIALSVLQLAVASVLTTEGSFGAALVGMLLLMLWTLSVFTLYRGRIRVAQSMGNVEDGVNTEDSLSDESDHESSVTIRNGLQMDSHEPWIGWRFRGIVGFAFIASVFVAAVTFVIFPRVWTGGSPLAEIAGPRKNALFSQTGFTEEVQLGDIGQIMQTDARVLQFEITRVGTGDKLTPDAFADALRTDEILFRGNALGQYDQGRWSVDRMTESVFEHMRGRRFEGSPDKADIKIHIVQDPPLSTFAFAPAPARDVTTATRGLHLGRRNFTSSLTFKRKDQRNRRQLDGPAQFDAWYDVPDPSQAFHSPDLLSVDTHLIQQFLDQFRGSDRQQFYEQSYAFNGCITPNLETQLPRLTELAKNVCAEDGELVSQRASIQRIVGYLNSSGRFRYSLTNSIRDSTIDPIEDFLINRRTGHCEYFASAAALMLQAVGVPARVVNGYKGYEQNSVSGQYEVKQKHAHAWLEAYIDGHWETLDPTPSAEREEAVSQTSQLSWWKDLGRTFNDKWREFVEQMTPQRQQELLRPWIDSAKEKWKVVQQQGVWELLKEFWSEVVMHPEKWFSLTTGVVTFLVLLIVGLFIQRNPFTWFKDKLSRWLHPASIQQRSVVRFYDNFRDVCRRHGLSLPESQTAQENANLASQRFATRLAKEGEAELPDRIAKAFNLVRFGNTTLSTEQLASLRNDVARLGDLLKVESRSLSKSVESSDSVAG